MTSGTSASRHGSWTDVKVKITFHHSDNWIRIRDVPEITTTIGDTRFQDMVLNVIRQDGPAWDALATYGIAAATPSIRDVKTCFHDNDIAGFSWWEDPEEQMTQDPVTPVWCPVLIKSMLETGRISVSTGVQIKVLLEEWVMFIQN